MDSGSRTRRKFRKRFVPSSTTPRLLRIASAVVASVGLLAAVWIFAVADANVRDPELSKRDVQEARRIGGQVTEVTIEMNAFVRSLGHGRRLACTIGVVALGAAGFG